MTLYDMSVESCSGLEAAFKVYTLSKLPGAEIGFTECFGDGCNGIISVFGETVHGEANAVVSHALVDFEF